MIDPISGPPSATGARRVPSAASGAAGVAAAPFRVRSEATAATVPLSDIAGIGIAGMIALQEHEADAARDRDAKRRGVDLLAALRSLQLRLLTGGITLGQLQDLAALAADVPEAADPSLRTLVASIAMRARIEMARFEGAG